MNPPVKPKDGVSLKVKILVILLTLLTVVAFSVFFFRLIFKISSSAKISAPAKQESWAQDLQKVGDKLKKAGLKKQAIDQYSQFLQHAKVDSKTRARVSETIGELHAGLGDCPEALVWFFQAQVAGPDAGRVEALKSQIDDCLKEIKPSQP